MGSVRLSHAVARIVSGRSTLSFRWITLLKIGPGVAKMRLPSARSGHAFDEEKCK